MIGAMALAIGVTFLSGMVGHASGQMTRLEMQVTAWTYDVRRHHPGTLDDHAKRIPSSTGTERGYPFFGFRPHIWITSPSRFTDRTEIVSAFSSTTPVSSM